MTLLFQMFLAFMFIFLAALFGGRLGAREALNEFKAEIIEELQKDNHFSTKPTARTILDTFKEELIKEIKEDIRS